MTRPARVFVLSPAHCGGERARLLFREGAAFDLARRVRRPPGAPLGEVFSFLSGLYFRGKLAYAEAFATPPSDLPGVYVITPSEGLRRHDEQWQLTARCGSSMAVNATAPQRQLPLKVASSTGARFGRTGSAVPGA